MKKNRMVDYDKLEDLESLVYKLLKGLGLNMEDINLIGTPKRIVKMYKELFSSVGKKPNFNLTEFTDKTYSDLVVIDNISFSSMCSHHFLPFTGKCHIGYLPDGKVLGLSKFARVVDFFAQKPQIQERLVHEIADYLYKEVNPKGLIIHMVAHHTCMAVRGVKKSNHNTTTTAIRGEIDKQEFFDILKVN